MGSGVLYLAGLVGVLSVSMAGCDGALSPQATELLASAHTCYAGGDDRSVIRSMDEFLAANARSNRAGEAFYLRGLAKYRTGDLAGAKADLAETLDRAGHDQVRLPALMAMGDLAYQTDDMDHAGRMYAEALDLVARGDKPSDHAHYRLGCVYQRQGRWEDADVQFSKVVYFFADSLLAKRARSRINSKAWTVQAAAVERKSRAEALAETLRKNALPAQVRIVQREGDIIYLVQVGRVGDYPSAVALLPAVRRLSQEAFVFVTR